MKRKIVFMFLSFVALYAYSQAYYKASRRDTLGAFHLRVSYEMKFMPDTLDRTNFDKRHLILDIGKNGLSCYMERNKWIRDSIGNARIVDGKVSDRDIDDARRLAGRVYDNYQILKSYPDSEHLSYLGYAGLDKFEYKEKPDFNWQLKSTEKKTIGGYTCSLAMGSYAGRTYKVWYTTEISVSDGPWKFRGLPGLILEVEDLSGEYFYTCTKIQKHEGLIIVEGMDNVFKTTRERFLKAFQRTKEDPGAIVQSLGNKVQGDVLKKKRAKRAYNPQEKY